MSAFPRLGERTAIVSLLLAFTALPATAQWDPPNGEWGKQDSYDIRVMTWNVEDSLCSTNPKVEGQNNWCAVARIVAAFQPDVLLLQECADNSGNGTGSGADSVSTMNTVLQLFVEGGNDPFLGGGSVTSYVRKYAPGYSLDYRYVSSNTDYYNRNVVLSRFPLGDLNGDGKSAISDIPWVSADQYAPGGDGGLRGFQLVEIDLPDDYVGDLVVGNAHLKAGWAGSDHDQRIEAAQNVAYVIDYWLNGAGSGVPDPNGKISDSPAATNILAAQTPVIIGGDWNEDEGSNGTKGPAEWFCRAQLTGGSDGTDRDRSDSTLDSAHHYFTGSGNTSGSKKYDYLAWQDSITSHRMQTIFESGGTPYGSLPPEVVGFPSPTTISSHASDHRPVIADFIVEVGCSGPVNYCDGEPNSVGPGAAVSWAGEVEHSTNLFYLTASGAIPNQFGLFYYGPNQIQLPFGDGYRCVGGGIYRLGPPQLADGLGGFSRYVDLNQPPADSGPGEITPGSVWNFQLWYRDPAGPLGHGFNLSDGLAVTFCP
jgi:endonuclease/exonuclease/phosphatase family metal-dependent hydrolase